MKFVKIGLAALMAASLVACSSSSNTTEPQETAETKEEVATEGNYTLINGTRNAIKELYVYQTGSEDKGENYVKGDELAKKGDSIEVNVNVSEEEAEGYTLTVEYVNENGDDVVVFNNLHLETANLILLSNADVTSGATPFTQHGVYTIVNATGETITELYIYNNADGKGDNLLTEDLKDGETTAEPIQIDVMAAQAAAYEMTVEYVTESGTTATVFGTLHLETATLNLKPAADIESGATPFSAAE